MDASSLDLLLDGAWLSAKSALMVGGTYLEHLLHFGIIEHV